jgi:hypothetical protein
MNWIQQRLMAAAQFAKQKANNLYNNAPITQAVKQRSFQPLVTAMGNNAMSFMGTSKMKDPFINGSSYLRQSMMTPQQLKFNQGIAQKLARDEAQSALRNKLFLNKQSFPKATASFPPERLINNFIRRR